MWVPLALPVLLILFGITGGASGTRALAQQPGLYMPRPDNQLPVMVSADRAQHWQQGSYDVWLLSGHVHVGQGGMHVRGPEAVLWIENAPLGRPGQPTKVIAYFERNPADVVTLEDVGSPAAVSDASPTAPSPPVAGRMEAPEWFGRLLTTASVDLKLPPTTPAPLEKPPIVSRGYAHFGPQPLDAGATAGSTAIASPHVDTAVQQTQFAPPPFPSITPPTSVPAPSFAAASRASFRSVQVFPRSESDARVEYVQSQQGEQVVVVSGGINVVVKGLSVEGAPEMLGPLGDVDLEADRVVIWGIDASSLGGAKQPGDKPLEIYMEGNIVFRQGDRIIYADRMFFDVRRQVGTILNAELLTPLPQVGNYQYQGLVRLRAGAVRQLDNSRFVAQNGMVTTSRLEEPSYNFAADTITFENNQATVTDPLTGVPAVDPFTGQPVIAQQNRVTSESNFVYVSGVPVFYWPRLETDLRKPTVYIDNIRFRSDSVFGQQVLLDLDAFQLLSMQAPEGVQWNFDLDYLSQRGLGYGTTVDYARDSFFQLPGPTSGHIDPWFISDDGVDNLGRERRDIVPEAKFRGRGTWEHRQHLTGGLLDDWTVQAEVGWLSDRTFLEQYYENEWDNDKDKVTGIRLKRTYDNQSLSIEANGRVNDFFTQTQWLPRLDHYWLGQPLLDTQLSWFAHSQAAYANMGIASQPTNPTLASQWTLLPWEQDSAGNPISGEGERLITRQEIDWPIDLAPFKVVPYALGELGHWGQDIEGNDIQRAYGQVGVRASIPFWSADPTIRDALFNLNGLAHKVVFDAEASYADANRNLTQFPLYDELDDDSIEEFHRRLFFDPFGGGLLPQYYLLGPPSTIDPKFDPRFVALRSGLGGVVTSPAAEIADDLAAVRLGMRHRLQTKRGPIGEQHIVDWVTFDSNVTYFPDAHRDNSNSDFGLADYDLRWHLGDRFSILSDGSADFFGDGLRTASIGVLLNRPATGNAYLGFRTMGGVIDANILTGTVNYRFSPKWVGSASSMVDLASVGNIGQAFAISRIGESLVTTIGGNVDASKGSVGFSFLVEPRFLPNSSVTRKTGIVIPPAGAYGLE